MDLTGRHSCLVEFRGSAEDIDCPLISRSKRLWWKKYPTIIEAFVVRKYEKRQIFRLHLKIPLFTLGYVYKYSRKREMTCLCNAPSDLASDAIAEPKTKKSPGDISDKRKQMLRKRVYSRALEQDVGGTLDSVCRVSPSAVARQKRGRIDLEFAEAAL